VRTTCTQPGQVLGTRACRRGPTTVILDTSYTDAGRRRLARAGRHLACRLHRFVDGGDQGRPSHRLRCFTGEGNYPPTAAGPSPRDGRSGRDQGPAGRRPAAHPRRPGDGDHRRPGHQRLGRTHVLRPVRRPAHAPPDVAMTAVRYWAQPTFNRVRGSSPWQRTRIRLQLRFLGWSFRISADTQRTAGAAFGPYRSVRAGGGVGSRHVVTFLNSGIPTAMVGYTRRARLPRDRLMLASRRRCRRRQR